MNFECPHCHEKTITPIHKAFAGSLTSKGTTCPKCRLRSVNGVGSTIFSSVVSLAALVVVSKLIFFSEYDYGFAFLVSIGAIAAAWVLSKLFDLIFGKLIPSQWV